MKLAKFVKLWAFEALCLPCQQRGEVASPYFYGEHPKRSTSKVGHSEILKYGQTYILRTFKREKPTESFTFSLLVFVALTRGQEMQNCARLSGSSLPDYLRSDYLRSGLSEVFQSLAYYFVGQLEPKILCLVVF